MSGTADRRTPVGLAGHSSTAPAGTPGTTSGPVSRGAHSDSVLPGRLAEPLARGKLPALNAIRAIAVMIVILFHGGFGLKNVPGGFGVTMFFVLSGFLITWLLVKEYARTDTVSLRSFYVRRTLRIVPVFWAYWLTMVAYETLRHKPIAWAHAVSALLYVSNYYSALVGDQPSKAFTHTWSLSVEEQFYLLWPAMFIAFFCRARRATSWLVALIAAIWVYRVVRIAALGPQQYHLYYYYAFETRCDAMLVGCVLAFVLSQRRLGRFWGLVTAHPVLLVATVLAAAVVSTVASWTGIWWTEYIVAGSLGPILVAVGIVQAIAFSGTRGWRWLESPVARYLGLISYSLYLWQQWTLDAVTTRLSHAPYIVQAFAAIGFTVLVASGSYHFIERPFLRLKDRIGHAAREGDVAHPRGLDESVAGVVQAA